MWSWVSHIAHILSCLHVGFCLWAISSFQIALCFFFSCRSSGNCCQIPLALWLVGGDPVCERRCLLALLCPSRREGGWEGRVSRAAGAGAEHTQPCRSTPCLHDGCPSPPLQCRCHRGFLCGHLGLGRWPEGPRPCSLAGLSEL